MSGSGVVRRLALSAMLILGALAALPTPSAQAGSAFTGWSQRLDAADGASDATDTHSVADGALTMFTALGQVGIDGRVGGHEFSAYFAAAGGQLVQAGATYHVDVVPPSPGAPTSPFRIMRDGMMCGRTADELDTGYPPAVSATGWFHVSEITRDAQGSVTSFAATYEINCQYVGGPLGMEGSVAVNSVQAAVPVPAAPVAPGPVTNLKPSIVGPTDSGDNDLTLTWTNPGGFGDVEVDSVAFSDASKLPALLGPGDNLRYRGRASRYHVFPTMFGDTQTFRVVPRGPSGRMGKPTLLVILGTRINTPESRRVTIGQPLLIPGRLTESWDYRSPKDIMNGPPLPGRTLVLCKQSSETYVDQECDVVDSATTAPDGSFTMSVAPRDNSYYRVMLRAHGNTLGNTSYVVVAEVAPKTDLLAPESLDPRPILERAGLSQRAARSVRRGSVIHFTTLRARAGSTGVVRLQRLDGKTWHTIVTKSLGHGTSRRVALPYREKRAGQHAYRVVKLADARHVNGRSRVVHVDVR